MKINSLLFNHLIAASVLLLSSASNLVHANEVEMGSPTYSGSACPDGSLNMTADPATNRVQFSFNKIAVQTDTSTGQVSGKLECQVVIPLTVQEGYQATVAPVDFTGNIYQPMGYSSRLDVVYLYDYPYHKQAKSSFWYQWKNYQDRKFTITVPQKGQVPKVWSPCGMDTKVRMNISLSTDGSSTWSSSVRKTSEFALDGIQGFELIVKKCVVP